jgi:elongation factor G
MYAHVALAIAPAARGAGFSFTDESPPGAVPKEFLPSIEQGIRGAMSRGSRMGYPMVDVAVRLTGGRFHPVDSSGMAFEVAASMAFRKAAEAAEPYLLEPVMAVEVVAPEEYVGEVIADLQARRGEVRGLASRAGARVVTALVPLRALFGHVSDLRSKTRGRASASMELSHHDRVPESVCAGIAEGRRA